MNKKVYYLTKEGEQELKSELEELKSKRREVAEKLKIARDFGDLSENSEYHNARDEQLQIELRIQEIEKILANSEIIEHSENCEEVKLGCEVTLEADSGEAKVYKIVGSVEANPLENKISDESLIGKSLLGKKLGEQVEIELPSGRVVYKIKSIS